MKKLQAVSAIFLYFILLTACSGNDAALEKELNTKIDNYSEATMAICDCVEANSGDCADERSAANKIYEDLSVVNEAETEEKLDPEVYSAMLESIALINKDYAQCTNVLFRRLNE